MRSLALVVVFAVGSAQAGVKLTFERVRQGKASQMSVQLEGAKLRTDSSSEKGEVAVVWDGDAKSMTSWTGGEKTYSRMDEQTLRDIKEKYAAMKAQMEAQMAKMSPEQRAQMEQMMKGRGMPAPQGPRPEAKITPLNKKKKVGQFDCELYERTWGDLKQEVCIAAWDKMPLTKDDLKPFQSMSEFLLSLLDVMPGGAAAADAQSEVMGELEKYKGFPVETTSTAPTGGVSTLTFKSASRAAIDKGVFAPPTGYTEKKTAPR